MAAHADGPNLPNSRANGVVVAVAAFMVFLTGAIFQTLSPLLPTLRTVYDVSVVDISWVFTLLLIGASLGTAILPRLGDVIGDRFTVTLCPATMAVGLALAATGSFPALLIGVVGIGVGAVATAIVIGALRRLLAEAAIARAVTVASVGIMVGTGFGYIAGGFAVEHISVRAFFALTAVLAGLVAVAVYAVFPPTPAAERGSLGVLSVVTLVLWLLAILFGVSKGPEWGWADPRIWGLLTAGVIAAVLWARRERKLATPVIDFALLRSPRFQRTLFGGITLGMGGSAVAVLVPTIAQTQQAAGYGLGATVLGTGLLMLPYAVFGLVGVTVAGRLTARDRPLLAAGLGALGHCLAATWLAFCHGSVWQVVVGTTLYGIGIGLLQGGLYGSVQSVVPPAKAGMGNAMLGLTAALAGSVGPIVYAVILAQESVPGLAGVPAEGQFTTAFLVNASIDLLCTVVCLSGIRRAGVDLSVKSTVAEGAFPD